MRAVAYCRVSTIEADQLNSLQNQKEHYQELFAKESFDTVEVGLLFKKHGKEELREHINSIFADEGISGTKLKNREAFKYMMKCASKKEFDVIYVKNIARFARSVEDGTKALKDLKEYGVKVIFEDGNLNSFDNEMVINMFFSVAQEESRNKSVAIQFGVQKAQKKGKWNSQVPFGYKIVDGFLQLNENEIETVKKIFDMYLNKGWGTGKICRWLNDEKILTKKGKQWSQSQIGSILDNCIFTGKQINHTYQTFDVNRNIKQKIEPEEWNIIQREELRIITDDQFLRIQIERKKRREMLSEGHRTSSVHLFSNLLYCNNCESNMKRKKRHTYSRKEGTSKDIGYEWTCQMNDMYGKTRCNTRNAIPENILIELLNREQLKVFKDIDYLNGCYESYIERNFNQNSSENKEDLMAEIKKLKDDRELNFELLSQNIIDRYEYKGRNSILQKKISAKESILNTMIYQEKEKEEFRIKFNDFVNQVQEIDLNNATNVELKKLIQKIYVDTSEKGNPPVLIVVWNFFDIKILMG